MSAEDFKTLRKEIPNIEGGTGPSRSHARRAALAALERLEAECADPKADAREAKGFCSTRLSEWCARPLGHPDECHPQGAPFLAAVRELLAAHRRPDESDLKCVERLLGAEAGAAAMREALEKAQRLADTVDQGKRSENSDEWRIPWTPQAVDTFVAVNAALATDAGAALLARLRALENAPGTEVGRALADLAIARAEKAEAERDALLTRVEWHRTQLELEQKRADGFRDAECRVRDERDALRAEVERLRASMVGSLEAALRVSQARIDERKRCAEKALDFLPLEYEVGPEAERAHDRVHRIAAAIRALGEGA